MLDIKENIPLKEYTTFNIGGNAKYFVEVTTVDELKEALDFARDKDLKYFILAGGSNVLFSDDGFDGVVIKIKIGGIEIKSEQVTVGSGVTLLVFLEEVAESGLSGGENLAGIPGSVGGAVRGNAGAFGTEIKDILQNARALNMETGEIEVFDNARCEFKYRKSFFKKNDNYIIVDTTFKLVKGEKEQIKSAMEEIITKRNAKHMQNIKSAGSFFINPTVDENVQKMFEHDTGQKSRDGRVPAGWLLDSCGIFQKRIGDIQAGLEHANYFINRGEGTADQVIQLSALAKTRIRDEYGVHLKEEVVMAGF
jgi:UDP-N-acetylmuramate dehydrogenase